MQGQECDWGWKLPEKKFIAIIIRFLSGKKIHTRKFVQLCMRQAKVRRVVKRLNYNQI